jgi:hypothetical protein
MQEVIRHCSKNRRRVVIKKMAIREVGRHKIRQGVWSRRKE